MEHNYFECKCTDFEHVFRLTLHPDDGEMYLEVHLDCYFPWYKRAWIALKYVFGIDHMYGHYDSTILRESDYGRLRQLLDRSEQLIKQRPVALG